MTPSADGTPRRTTRAEPTTTPHRLDELVWHLSGCHPAAARRALRGVDAPADLDEAISAVARALVTVKSRVPVPV